MQGGVPRFFRLRLCTVLYAEGCAGTRFCTQGAPCVHGGVPARIFRLMACPVCKEMCRHPFLDPGRALRARRCAGTHF